MDPLGFFLILGAGALFVAYANGANDNFKGAATLYGSGTLGYRSALAWATATTLAGSLASVFLAGKLVRAFSGEGLVPDAVAAEPAFLAAVALGAALTLFLAARLGFPISTTHALTGGLVGAGLVAAGAGLELGVLGKSFFLPLAVSPVAALALTAAAQSGLSRFGGGRAAAREWCLCVSESPALVLLSLHASAGVLSPGPPLVFTWGEPGRCAEHRGPSVIVRRQSLVDALHFLSSGAVSFARGLNDAPKIVGLLVVAKSLRVEIGLLAVAVAMALGGILHARRVAETMSRRITSMSHGEGLLANLTTSFLVLGASGTGLPVSTTHVSCGAIFGGGLASGRADRSVVRLIVASWVLTLPIAAALAAAAFAVLQWT